MPLDGFFLHGICRELNDKLTGGRIERVYQPAKEEIVLMISKPGRKFRLVMSSDTENPRIHLTTEVQANPVSPPVFCMLLRKHLEGGRIIEFRQPGLDRVIDMRVDCRDELGRPVIKSLICEIMGRHSNIILVSRQGDIILDGIRRYSHAVSRHREVLPGRPYVSPPHQGKTNPLEIDEEEFRKLLLAGNFEDRLAVVLQKSLDGFSIPTCRELVRVAGLDPDILLDHCGEHELICIWRALDSMRRDIIAHGVQASLVSGPDGRPVDIFPFQTVPQEEYVCKYGSANEIADLFFTSRLKQAAFEQERKKIKSLVKKETRRVQKKLALQRKSVAEAGNADLFRLYGELLTSYLHLVRRGMKSIELDNFYDPDGGRVTVPLNPELTGPENAQAYFRKYNKLRNTGNAARKMVSMSEEELFYLDSISASLEMAENLNDLDDIKRELRSQGYLKDSVTRPGGRKSKAGKPVSKPLSFKSSDGFLLLVGKNNRQNDIVTLKMAADHDIWLHTCKIPGSHVIIRTNGREVPERTLLEAAALAAYFSRASKSSNVPVDYTFRKHVKKPGGARPGYVIYEKQKTLYVNPGLHVIPLDGEQLPVE